MLVQTKTYKFKTYLGTKHLFLSEKMWSTETFHQRAPDFHLTASLEQGEAVFLWDSSQTRLFIPESSFPPSLYRCQHQLWAAKVKGLSSNRQTNKVWDVSPAGNAGRKMLHCLFSKKQVISFVIFTTKMDGIKCFNAKIRKLIFHVNLLMESASSPGSSDGNLLLFCCFCTNF